MTSIDWINVLSYIIGVENLQKNDEQIKELQQHLDKQDKQFNEILLLLKEIKDGRKC